MVWLYVLLSWCFWLYLLIAWDLVTIDCVCFSNGCFFFFFAFAAYVAVTDVFIYCVIFAHYSYEVYSICFPLFNCITLFMWHELDMCFSYEHFMNLIHLYKAECLLTSLYITFFFFFDCDVNRHFLLIIFYESNFFFFFFLAVLYESWIFFFLCCMKFKCFCFVVWKLNVIFWIMS